MINCWFKQVRLKMFDKVRIRCYICSYVSRILNPGLQDLNFTSREIYAIPCVRHYINSENTVLYRNHYSNIRNCICCYIGTIPRILTDSY